MMTQHQTYTAFVRGAVVAAGRPAEVIATISAQGGDARRALIFSDRTGDQARLSGSGEIEATAPSEEAQGAVTLQVRVLPRHARWLEAQSGGPSASVRRLVEAARRHPAHLAQEARDAAYRFMSRMAGDFAGYEEACRALFAGDRARFDAAAADWPADVRDYGRRLAGPALS